MLILVRCSSCDKRLKIAEQLAAPTPEDGLLPTSMSYGVSYVGIDNPGGPYFFPPQVISRKAR